MGNTGVGGYACSLHYLGMPASEERNGVGRVAVNRGQQERLSGMHSDVKIDVEVLKRACRVTMT